VCGGSCRRIRRHRPRSCPGQSHASPPLGTAAVRDGIRAELGPGRQSERRRCDRRQDRGIDDCRQRRGRAGLGRASNGAHSRPRVDAATVGQTRRRPDHVIGLTGCFIIRCPSLCGTRRRQGASACARDARGGVLDRRAEGLVAAPRRVTLAEGLLDGPGGDRRERRGIWRPARAWLRALGGVAGTSGNAAAGRHELCTAVGRDGHVRGGRVGRVADGHLRPRFHVEPGAGALIGTEYCAGQSMRAPSSLLL